MNRRLTSTIIAISLTISSIAQAEDCKPSVLLKIGDKITDCDRVGLSLDTDLKVRKELVEGDFNKKILEEQKKVIDLKDLTIKYTSDQKDLWKMEADRSHDLYLRERDRNDKYFWIGIAAGILLTVGAGYAIGQAANAR